MHLSLYNCFKTVYTGLSMFCTLKEEFLLKVSLIKLVEFPTDDVEKFFQVCSIGALLAQ